MSRPRLTAAEIADDSRLLSLVDSLFELHAEHAKMTRRILAVQQRLQELASEDAWVEYLHLEERVNERCNCMLVTAARWAFNEGRRTAKGK